MDCAFSILQKSYFKEIVVWDLVAESFEENKKI
jgi:hypothetical protein